MTCKPDNKRIFEKEVVYSTKCEICKLFVKYQHYRSCEDRFKAHQEQGNDILAPVKEANRIAQAQTGQKIAPVDGVEAIDAPVPKKADNPGVKNKPKQRSRHRGR